MPSGRGDVDIGILRRGSVLLCESGRKHRDDLEEGQILQGDLQVSLVSFPPSAAALAYSQRVVDPIPEHDALTRIN